MFESQIKDKRGNTIAILKCRSKRKLESMTIDYSCQNRKAHVAILSDTRKYYGKRYSVDEEMHL